MEAHESKAHDSGASIAVAVEVQQPHAAHPFAAGVCTGFACAALLVQAYFIHAIAPYRDMYRDFGGTVSGVTALVISNAWLFAVPLVGAIVLAVIGWRRPRGLWPYVVLSLGLTATVVVTWIFFDAPIRELSGHIAG